MTKAMPVGLCSVTAPFRSAARGAPVKGDGRDPHLRGSQLDQWIDQTHRGKVGDLWNQVLPTGGAPRPLRLRLPLDPLALGSGSAPAASGALELTEPD